MNISVDIQEHPGISELDVLSEISWFIVAKEEWVDCDETTYKPVVSRILLQTKIDELHHRIKAQEKAQEAGE